MTERRREQANATVVGLDPKTLQQRLDAALAGVKRSRAVVACSIAGTDSFAAVGNADARAGAWTFPTGCITKLLVGALVSEAVASGRVGADDAIAPLVGGVPGTRVLGGTTVRHLLEHTHGLDDTAIQRAPHRDGDFIDLEALLERLAAHRFAAPGEIYSYSNAGAWILAAMLETLHGQPFERLLGQKLLGPMGLDEHRRTPSLGPAHHDGVCPAMGGTLAMSAADLLAFLKAQLAADGGAWRLSAAGTPDRITSLPGWNALERGVYFGWKCHGEGWVGHSSTWPGASLMVRVQPRERIAIVLASHDHPAPLVAAKLFADMLPEYRRLSIPKPLSRELAAELNLRRFCGRYASAAERLSVDFEPEGGNSLRLAGASFSVSLVPAADDLFLSRPPAPEQRSFVQFIDVADSRCRYLWDGRRILRRI